MVKWNCLKVRTYIKEIIFIIKVFITSGKKGRASLMNTRMFSWRIKTNICLL